MNKHLLFFGISLIILISQASFLNSLPDDPPDGDIFSETVIISDVAMYQSSL